MLDCPSIYLSSKCEKVAVRFTNFPTRCRFLQNQEFEMSNKKYEIGQIKAECLQYEKFSKEANLKDKKILLIFVSSSM